MECKKIQKLLLTDYIDGEASDALKNEVERHVNICHTCRRFERDLLKTAIEPLRKAKESKPPDLVWNHIKETLGRETLGKEALGKEAIILEERGKSGGFLAQVLDYLLDICHWGSLSSISKPVLALATVLCAVLVLIATIIRFQTNNQRVAQVEPDKQVEYLAHEMGDSEYFSPEENNGYGTAIEEYFL